MAVDSSRSNQKEANPCETITLIASLAVATAGWTLVGCQHSIGGYHSTSSEQNVGSRSSHGVYGGTRDETGTASGSRDTNAPATPFSTTPVVTPNNPNGNTGTAGTASSPGTSQENAGSSSPSGAAGQTAAERTARADTSGEHQTAKTPMVTGQMGTPGGSRQSAG